MKVIEELLSCSSKTLQSERRNRPFRMPIYLGAFASRVRVVAALRALGVSLLRGLHERETRRKGKCRLDKGTRRHLAGWHRGQQAREGSGTRASESFASPPAWKGSLP